MIENVTEREEAEVWAMFFYPSPEFEDSYRVAYVSGWMARAGRGDYRE